MIENIGGAGGNIGMGHAARSEADGYTFLLATNAYSVNASLYNKIPYDPLKDFVGVCELATSPNTFVVKSELPAKTVKEFAALARANPDKFNCATPPIGTTPQISAEMLKLREKLPKLEVVVFKGGGDALQALLSGTVQLSSGSLPPAAPHIKAGTLRCLAVTGENRWPDLPDVPTMVESGYKDFVLATDTVMLAPAKTPPEAIKWLETETLKVLGTRGNERDALQARLPGAAQGRQRRLGARHQGNRYVQGHHRSGRHEEALKSAIGNCNRARRRHDDGGRSNDQGCRRADQNNRADRGQPADDQARDDGGRGNPARRQRAGAHRGRQRLVGWGEAGVRAGDDRRHAREHGRGRPSSNAARCVGRDPADIDGALAAMDGRMYGNHGAKAAIEIALHDLAGRATGKARARTARRQRSAAACRCWA